MKRYYVYILSSKTRTLYIGVTSDLMKRIWQHQKGLVEGFTKKYEIKNLVYFEETSDVQTALNREKQLKGWVRRKKVALIKSANPAWLDLCEDLVPLDPSLRSG